VAEINAASVALDKRVAGMTRDKMIAAYRQARVDETWVEVDRRGGESWEDRSAESKRAAGVRELKAALEREFEVRARKDPGAYSVAAVMAEVLHG
jgi:hypothetical protein